MNWLSYFQKSNVQPVAIFDVGNGSVGVALVAPVGRKNLKPEIYWSHREDILIAWEKDSKRLLLSMLLALEHATKELTEKGLNLLPDGVDRRIGSVYCVLSAPWSISGTKIVKLKEDKPFAVTVDLFESIVTKEEKTFISADENSVMAQSGRGEKKELSTVEKKVIKARLNGYEVRIPFGKKVTRLELSIYLSATSKAIQKTVERAVGKYLPHVPVKFGTFALVSFAGIRESYPGKEDFIFVDVSGEMTEVSFVRHRVIMESMSFPYGKNAIIRKLARELKTTVELARSELTLSNSNTLGKENIGVTSRILDSATTEWLTFFGRTVEEFAKSHFVPTDVFLTADTDVKGIFERTISKIPLSQFSLDGERYRVVVLDGDRLLPFVELSPEAEDDEFLLLESLFLRQLWADEANVISEELVVK